jgi:hypothetical protein
MWLGMRGEADSRGDAGALYRLPEETEGLIGIFAHSALAAERFVSSGRRDLVPTAPNAAEELPAVVARSTLGCAQGGVLLAAPEGVLCVVMRANAVYPTRPHPLSKDVDWALARSVGLSGFAAAAAVRRLPQAKARLIDRAANYKYLLYRRIKGVAP